MHKGKVCINCRGVHVAREPVCATGNAAVPHMLKKTSASTCAISHLQVFVWAPVATASAKKFKNLRCQSSTSLLPLQPSHDTIGHRKNGASKLSVCTLPSTLNRVLKIHGTSSVSDFFRQKTPAHPITCECGKSKCTRYARALERCVPQQKKRFLSRQHETTGHHRTVARQLSVCSSHLRRESLGSRLACDQPP